MTWLLERAAGSRPVQLAATAVVSGAVVAAALLGYQQHVHAARLRSLKQTARRQAETVQAEADEDENENEAAEQPIDAEEARALALARRAQAGDYAEEVILEQLTRNRAFLTPDGLTRVRDATVVVVGCGGVGSHCAAALARSGVGRLRLVDFDQVSLSSLNRHAVATLADVGRSKVRVLARRLLAVAPWVRFDLRQAKFDALSAQTLLGPWQDAVEGVSGASATAARPRPITYIVDAIDNIDSKVELLRYCHVHGLPIIASMGAGTKSDPTKVVVGDMAASKEDRLSRATRRRLRLLGITSGITAVYSTEAAAEGKAALLPLPDEQYARLGRDAVRELGALPDFRVRILPVLGTMPAVFGYTLASHILLTVSGYPYEYAAYKGRDKMYDQILGAVHSAEERLIRAREKKEKKEQTQPAEGTDQPTGSLAVGLRTPLTAGDVAFLIEDVYYGRSAVSGLPTHVTLVRWRLPPGDDGTAAGLVQRVRAVLADEGDGTTESEQRSTVLALADLVCMTREEAARHQDEVLLGGRAAAELYDAATLARIEARRTDAAAYEKYRM